MNYRWLPRLARRTFVAASFLGLTGASAAAQSEIVLHTQSPTAAAGNWQGVADSTAASGTRLWNPDYGTAKLGTPYASPTSYVELTFNAEAGRAYRFWARGKADGNSYTNDSVFVQFSGSVDASGNPIYRIGTSSATWVGIEQCSGCGIAGWGWSDNAYGGDGAPIFFATTGTQRIRLQQREDGISIDQIVLSAVAYRYSAPGPAKYDTTILPATSTTTTPTTTTTTPTTTTTTPTTTTTTPTTTTTTSGSTTEIVLTSAQATAARGNWRTVADSTAAGGTRYWNSDAGLAKLSTPYAAPADYVDFTFTAEAGKPYRLWIRGKADYNAYTNDSVFVQFSGSVTSAGAAVHRIGTTDAAMVSIEACSGCGLSNWGWEDNGYASNGAPIYFANTGTQTLRVQRREDGISIDQIVLSAQKYLSSSPGLTKNDTTILTPSTTTEPAPAPAPAPAPEPAPAPAPAPAPSTGTYIRVLQWNLHHGVGTDGTYNITRIADWMAYMQPEVILLNEVEKYTSWGYEDQPARFKAMLEQKTGRTWYSHFAQEFGQWSSNGKGHQILSVYPFQSVGYSIITQSSGLNGAGAISQATIIVNGRNLNFLLTHLDPYDPAMRLVQAQDAIRWSASFAENRILAGDMNAWDDQASILEIDKYYYDTWELAAGKGTAYASSSITPYGATKKGRIDYIFLSKGSSNVYVIDSMVYDTRDGYGIMPSDHRPVVTTLLVK